MPKIKFFDTLYLVFKNRFLSLLFISGAIIIVGLILFYGYSKPATLELTINNNLNSLITNEKNTNILVLGIPGKGYNGAFLTDTIFIVNFNPNNQVITLISIPRDLWIQIPHSNNMTKINSLYAFDNLNISDISQAKKFDLIKTKITEITGLNIDFTFVFDLTGFGNLIDRIGGVNIWLDKTVLDPRFKDPYDSNDIFDLAPGWHTLDGKTSIKFVRTRFAPEGDFYRINNQHLIINAIKDKILELNKIWSILDWFKLWQSLSNHYVTDIDFASLLNLINSFKNKNIKMQSITISNRNPDNLLISTFVNDYFNNATTSVYVLIPRGGFENYQEIQNFIKTQLLK